MSNELKTSLSNFMEVADKQYQEGTYKSLNEAFPHLNDLYETLLDMPEQSDVVELAIEVIEKQKLVKLHKILDEIVIHKQIIKTSKETNSIINSQSKIITLLEQYILVDSNITQ